MKTQKNNKTYEFRNRTRRGSKIPSQNKTHDTFIPNSKIEGIANMEDT